MPQGWVSLAAAITDLPLLNKRSSQKWDKVYTHNIFRTADDNRSGAYSRPTILPAQEFKASWWKNTGFALCNTEHACRSVSVSCLLIWHDVAMFRIPTVPWLIVAENKPKKKNPYEKWSHQQWGEKDVSCPKIWLQGDMRARIQGSITVTCAGTTSISCMVVKQTARVKLHWHR